MRFYLDEDISPKVAEILRKDGIEALSAHEAGMFQASDQEQLEFAVQERRCLVTRNRDDFIRLTVRFFNDHRSHFGILIIPHSIPGDQFSRMARLLRKFDLQHPSGLEPYRVAFLPSK